MAKVRRFTALLFGLLLAVVLWTWDGSPAPLLRLLPQETQRVVIPVSQTLPEVVAPSGLLADVFTLARPATLRIEARLNSRLAPIPLGVGTGFFFSADGLVLTAFHVVDRSEMIGSLRGDVRYVGVAPDEQEYPLELLGFDAYLDLAVLRAEVPRAVPYLTLTQLEPSIDSEVLAIGNSRGDFLQGRVGRVLALDVKSPRARFAEGTIELTAALSPGDSGGPVLNASGEAVGVVSFISFNPDAADPPPYLQGVIRPSYASYAVPVTLDSEVLTALIAGSRRDIPVIGLSFANNPDYQPRFSRWNLGRRPGAIVGQVQPGGPADLAGLRTLEVRQGEIAAADVIIAVDDHPTPSVDALIEELYRKEVGQTITVTVQRGSETFKVRVTLGAKYQVFG